jgi:hypothetical protein
MLCNVRLLVIQPERCICFSIHWKSLWHMPCNTRVKFAILVQQTEQFCDPMYQLQTEFDVKLLFWCILFILFIRRCIENNLLLFFFFRITAKDAPFEQRLHLIYLVNDVLHHW